MENGEAISQEGMTMREAILASIRSGPATTFQYLDADVPGFRGPLGMFISTIASTL